MKVWIIQANMNKRLCYDVFNNYETQSKIYNFCEKGYVSNWDPVKISFLIDSKRTNNFPIENITYFSNSNNTFVCDEHVKETL